MNLANLCDEPHPLGTAHDIAVVLDLSPRDAIALSQSVSREGNVVLTNAQARRLLALAIKGARS